MSYVFLVLMVVLIFVGMPVGYALGVSALLGLIVVGGWDSVVGILTTVPFRTGASYTLTAVPMFILLAEFISRSKIVEDVFTAAHRWLERLPGGLGIATILASAGMGAMCGSSAASAATMAKISVPELKKYGYDSGFAAGIVAVSGTLAIMIPPSLSFIYYGMITETSIGKMLIAGILPGLLTATMYCLQIFFLSRVRPALIPAATREFNMRDRTSSLKSLWQFVLLIIVVIGSIYSGLATATEAASFGAFGALIISLLMRRLKKNDIPDAVAATVRTTGMVFTIIIGAMIFGYFLTITQIAQNIILAVSALDVPNWTIMGCVVVLYLILGCIMEATAIQFITLPLTFPLVMSLGYDAIWFGVVMVKLVEIGLITPPLGMNCYIVSGATDVPLDKVFFGTAYLLAIEFITLAILLAFPIISTYLPSLMKF